MKFKHSDNLKAIILLLFIITGVGMIESIPWWSFVVPVLAFGVFITLRRWRVSSFLTGFLAGFITWFGASLYYHVSFDGIIFDRFGAGLKIVILVLSGVVGGILAGLALYTGKSIVFDKRAHVKL